GKGVRIQSAETDVQHALLAETPTVTLQIGAEIKFRHFRANGAPRQLPLVHHPLGLLRCDHGFPVDLGSQKTRHRAESAACADYQAGPYLPVDDPVAVGAMQLSERFALIERCAGSLEQIVVELIAADAVTDRHSVSSFHHGATDATGAESSNRLQHAPACI